MYSLRECLHSRDSYEAIAIFDLVEEPPLDEPLPEGWQSDVEELVPRMLANVALRILNDRVLNSRVCVINEPDRCEEEVQIYIFVPHW